MSRAYIKKTIEYYNKNASKLVNQYESADFESVHLGISKYLPVPPAKILDIGSGSGRDASALSIMGHKVTAVEPATDIRKKAELIHSDVNIRWIKDTLPFLDKIHELKDKYNFIILSAVWMHLNKGDRGIGFNSIKELLAPEGIIYFSFKMCSEPCIGVYPVEVEEILKQAEDNDFSVLIKKRNEDILGRGDILWDTVVIRRNG